MDFNKLENRMDKLIQSNVKAVFTWLVYLYAKYQKMGTPMTI